LVAAPENGKSGTRIRPTAHQDACAAFLLQRSVSILCANIHSPETSKCTARFGPEFLPTGATFWFIYRRGTADFRENVILFCICTTDKTCSTQQLRLLAWNGASMRLPNASSAAKLSSRSLS